MSSGGSIDASPPFLLVVDQLTLARELVSEFFFRAVNLLGN
jgi:hypothetical protein